MAEVDVNGLMDKIERLAFQAGLNQGLAAGGAKTAETKTAEARPVKPDFGCDADFVKILLEKVSGLVLANSENSEDMTLVSYTDAAGGWHPITIREFRVLAGVLENVAKLM